MKIGIHVHASNTTGNPPVMGFGIHPDPSDPDWLDSYAALSQQVSREAIQDLRKAADAAEAMLDRFESEKAIREEIEARLAEAV